MSDLIIGFSGTRHGMTEAQRESVTDLLKMLQPAEVHHGDCVGSDAEFHDLVTWHTHARIVIHPPVNSQFRAWKQPALHGETRPADSYLGRNRKIVSECGVLIATPKTMKTPRGGTWYTIGHAKTHDVRTIIVRPDGEYESH